MKLAEGWKEGPVPSGTWNWGAVVLAGEEGAGFYFADFHGDYVLVDGKEIKNDQIVAYNNSITLPYGIGGKCG